MEDFPEKESTLLRLRFILSSIVDMHVLFKLKVSCNLYMEIYKRFSLHQIQFNICLTKTSFFSTGYAQIEAAYDILRKNGYIMK